MIEWRPEELAAWTGGVWEGVLPSGDLRGFCHDTRRLQHGEIFVALKTARRDGHDFLPVAAQAGAGAALVERRRADVRLPQLVVPDPLTALQQVAAIWRRAFPGPVVGITGSCGKTTARSILTALLGPRCHGTFANQNNLLGVPLTLTGLDPRHHDFAAVEAGIDRPGEMARLADMIRPSLTVITNIGDAHLDRLKTRDAIAEEKGQLGRTQRAKAVFGHACLRYAPFRDWPGESRVLYSREARDDGHSPTYALVQVRAPGARRILLTTPEWGQRRFDLASPSEGVAHTAALCLIAASWLGVSAGEARKRLANWRPGEKRGEIITHGRKTFYVDCYNSSPPALRDALISFDGCAGREPRCYVLGAMKELGEESEALHRTAVRGLTLGLLDRAICIGEEARIFADELTRRGAEPRQVDWFAQAEEASDALRAFEGWVFLKGSRACALEQLLPREPAREGMAVC
ncbi:MAG: UDP-N-acetylmuramoyl-tripeptide--D-alanyl-D-alanine ligase [Opitutales bacterium]